YNPMDEFDLAHYLGKLSRSVGNRPFVPISPYQAAAIVRSAIEYARGFGLSVPDNARSALRVLPTKHDAELRVECGRNGKPVLSILPTENVSGILSVLGPAFANTGYEVEVINFGELDYYDHKLSSGAAAIMGTPLAKT
ncbi:MAG: hypothetical protein FWD57_15650, partial [Polyangiaceae bacterium]|nr:hypothetical protein [Polyangiaceae bacterium]